MSTEDIAVARQLYDSFGQGDIPAVLALFDPAIEWREAEGNPYRPDGSPWVGPEAILQGLFTRIANEWDPFIVTPQRFTATEHGVLAEGRYTGRHAATGRPLDVQFAHVLTMREGRLTHFQQYVDTAGLQATMQAAARA